VARAAGERRWVRSCSAAAGPPSLRAATRCRGRGGPTPSRGKQRRVYSRSRQFLTNQTSWQIFRKQNAGTFFGLGPIRSREKNENSLEPFKGYKTFLFPGMWKRLRRLDARARTSPVASPRAVVPSLPLAFPDDLLREIARRRRRDG
jgi:hypothetical protein